MPFEIPRLFVYGTLSPALAPAEVRPLVEQFKVIGNGSIAGSLYDLGDYPGAIQDTYSRRIFGSVYEVPGPKQFVQLDEYEGFDPGRPDQSAFVRRQVLVRMATGKRMRCWAYLYNRAVSRASRIPAGVYVPHGKP